MLFQIQGGTTQTMVILGSAPNMKTYLGLDFSPLNTKHKINHTTRNTSFSQSPHPLKKEEDWGLKFTNGPQIAEPGNFQTHLSKD